MPRFVKRPEKPVTAQQYRWDEPAPSGVYLGRQRLFTRDDGREVYPAYVNGRAGAQLVREGDYVVTNPDDPGDRYPVPAEKFEAEYEPLVEVQVVRA